MYEGSTYTPETEGYNWIKVTNEGTSALTVYYSYTPEDDRKNVGAYFTETSDTDTAEVFEITADNPQALPGVSNAESSVTAYLWLEQKTSQFALLPEDAVTYGTWGVEVGVKK
jgi:hypothetical protein